MSDWTTPRLALPLLAAGQAQKELTHNEALALVDIAIQASVVGMGIDTPPAAPLPGQAWLVGYSPSGDWLGRGGMIAGWTAGGWRFVGPREGMAVWSLFDQRPVTFRDGAWHMGEIRGSRLVIDGVDVVGAQGAAIAAPAGGSIVDAEARAVIGAILAALRTHGLIAP